MASFADVVLRGLGLAGQAFALGGIAFLLLILRESAGLGPEVGRHRRACLTAVAGGALALSLTQTAWVAVQLGALADEGGWPLRDVAETGFFRVSLARALAGLGLIAAVAVLARRPSPARLGVVLGLGVALVAGGAWMGHAAGRLAGRGLPYGFAALHQTAAAVWVGGLGHLALVAAQRGGEPLPAALLRRFSSLALAAVAALVASGIGLSVHYVGGPGGLLGTAYGVMVLTKVVVLGVLLALGAASFLAIRRGDGAAGGALRLRRFVEVEIGLGLTVVFAAASLTSAPPAVDIVADRATVAEVATRFTPRWPSLKSPMHEELPAGDRAAPRTDADRAWSEYNHHVAGLLVLAMGLLALIQRAAWGRWARHWPLLFLGLAAFMVVRNDPGAWPLGPEGFWEGMRQPAVLQHRTFVLLVIVFALFEWMVRVGRLARPGAARVFPLLCAVGGGLLLAHSHAMPNLKEEFLIEVTHVPLGLMGMFVGWTRWLELRLPAPGNRVPGRLWALGLVVVGLLLLIYRES